MLLEDDNTPPAAGHVKIRVVRSATRWFSPVDVYITQAGVTLPKTPTLAHFGPKEISHFGAGFQPYLEVPAGDYQVRVTYTGDPLTVLVDTGPLPLLDGQIRTIVFVDDEGDGPSFDIVLLEDLN